MFSMLLNLEEKYDLGQKSFAYLPATEAGPGLPGAARQLLVGCQCLAPNSGKLSISLVYFALFLLLLILLLLIVLLVKLVFVFNL